MDRLLTMRVFQTVVDEGGFAAAARLLELSPPVVTRLVADLEQHLGTRLLQRTTRKLALTEAGDAYLARVRAILHEIEDAEAAAAASTRDLRGTVRVVAPPVVATNFLAPMLSHWHAQQPLLMLDIDIDPYASARVDEFDVTFMVAAEGFDANIVARPLMQGESIVVASPAYLERKGLPLQPQDLEHHDYLRDSSVARVHSVGGAQAAAVERRRTAPRARCGCAVGGVAIHQHRGAHARRAGWHGRGRGAPHAGAGAPGAL